MTNEEKAILYLQDKITNTKQAFEKSGKKWTDRHELDMQAIYAGLWVLSIITGKEYYIDDDGILKERV